MNYITQIVQTVRVPNVAAAMKLQAELEADGKFDLKKFSYQHKEIKEKGEIVEEYELVSATMIFNAEKEPNAFVTLDIEVDAEYGE